LSAKSSRGRGEVSGVEYSGRTIPLRTIFQRPVGRYKVLLFRPLVPFLVSKLSVLLHSLRACLAIPSVLCHFSSIHSFTFGFESQTSPCRSSTFFLSSPPASSLAVAQSASVTPGEVLFPWVLPPRESSPLSLLLSRVQPHPPRTESCSSGLV
jgi:hypothetical protein